MFINWYDIILYIGFALVSINLLPLFFISYKNLYINKFSIFLQTIGSALICAAIYIDKMNILYIIYPAILCVFGIIISLKLFIQYKLKKKRYFTTPPPINPYYLGY